MLPLLSTIRRILTPYEKRCAAVLCCTIFVASVLEVAGVGLIFGFFNLTTQPDMLHTMPVLERVYRMLDPASDMEFLMWAGLALVGAFVVKNLAAFGVIWAGTRFTIGKSADFSAWLLERYVARPYSFFLSHNSAGLKRNVLEEAHYVSVNVLLPLFQFIAEAATVALLCVFLLWQDVFTTVTLFTFLALGYGAYYLTVRGVLRGFGERRLAASEQRQRMATEVFNGIKAIQVSGSAPAFVDRYRAATKEFADTVFWNQVVFYSPRLVMETFGFFAIMGIVLFHLWNGEPMAEIIPTLVLYAAAGYRMMPAFNRMTATFSQIRFYSRSLEALEDDLAARVTCGYLKTPPPGEGVGGGARQLSPEPVVCPPPTAAKLTALVKPRCPPPRGGEVPVLPHAGEGFSVIRLDNVSYRYPRGTDESLSDVSLVIPKNHSVAFVGPSGSGKTTLIDLLVGLIRPTEGAILLDDVPLMADNAAAWRHKVGYVPQRLFFSDDTVARNIALGVADGAIDMARVREAARMARIDGFIDHELPEGYDTPLGEHGVRLSGGQAQRIGIARALYRQPEVLILDEATNALDSVTETEIGETIKQLSGRMTLIVIAHRLSTVRNCDTIFLMKDGRILEQGSYDGLVEGNTLFREMAEAGK